MELVEERVPGFEAFPFSIPAIRGLGKLALHPAVTFFIGENGSGKSTLMEAIGVRMGFSEVGGDPALSFSRRSPDGGLHDYLRIYESRHRRTADRFFLRAETVFELASGLDERDRFDPSARDWYGEESLHTRSHGEAFLAIVQNRLRRESLFLMDEPEAALSPSRQLTLIKEMDWLVRSGCQFLIATHSPILMAYPDAIIYQLDEEGIREVAYKDTEHYTVTKSFLDRPEAFLRHLVE
ncbi:MAG: AAA family ATPase [Fimbriimonas sp.]